MRDETENVGDQSSPEAQGTYKENLDALRAAVDELEAGQLNIEEALKKYEKAIAAYRRCRKLLDGAERKIEMLAKDDEGRITASDAGENFGSEPTGESP